jgi:hypothetical protein
VEELEAVAAMLAFRAFQEIRVQESREVLYYIVIILVKRQLPIQLSGLRKLNCGLLA